MNSNTIRSSFKVLSNSSIQSPSHETSTKSTVDDLDICIDNDVSDLLTDNFGKADGYAIQAEDKFIEDFDDNLPLLVEIFEDLKKAESVQSDNKVNNTEYKSSEKEVSSLHEEKQYEKSPEKTVFELQSEIEYKNELVRVEKLRKPKFQTLPACEKRAKQEAQWRDAVREAKKLTGFLCSSDNRQGVSFVPSRDSSDLSSLDLDRGENSAVEVNSLQTVPIVKSTIMENTKKHLSAANHYPANSRIFNRSLEQLQVQADAISSAYLSSKANRQQNQEYGEQSNKELHRTMDITKNLRDRNNNNVRNTNSDDVIPVMTDLGTCVTNNVINENNLVPSVNSNQVIQTTNSNFPTNPVKRYFPSIEKGSPSVFTEPDPSNTFNMLSRNAYQVQPRAKVMNASQTQNKEIVPHSVSNYLLPAIPPCRGSTVIQKPPLVSPRYLHTLSNRSKQMKKVHSKVLTLNLPTLSSCYNCQKLSKVLPYLAHNRRKVGVALKVEVKNSMVLLCEVCGCLVRETVIFGDHMKLDHVSTAHLPVFLENTVSLLQFLGPEESQNFIGPGETS